MLTRAEYLSRERAAELRSEFWDGELILRDDASWKHTGIKDDFAVAVSHQTKGRPLAVLTSDLKVTTPQRTLYAYPDVVIVREPPELEDDNRDVLLNPIYLVEVYSTTTAQRDRGPKFERYKTIPTLCEYVLVAEDSPRVERLVRQGDLWLRSVFEGIDRKFSLDSVSVTIALSDIYRTFHR